MKKRFCLVLMMSIFVCFAFGQGGNETTKETGNNEPVDLEFWYSVGGKGQKAMDALVEKYNASQNKVIVHGTFTGNYVETTKKVLAAIIADNAPDIAHLSNDRVAQFVNGGHLEDMAPYIAADKDFSKNDFIDQYINIFTFGNHIYGVPFNVSNPIMYYNKKLFKDAGLDPDDPPKTWDEVHEAAKKISALENGTIGFNINRLSGWLIEGYIWEFGGDWIASDNSAVKFTDKESLEVLKFMQNMYNEGIASYMANNTQFFSGKTGMTIASTASLADFISNTSDEIGVTSLPSKVKQAAPIGGGGLYVFTISEQKKKNAAWDFIKFMLSTESQIFWSKSTGYLVVTKPALNSDEMKQHFTEDERFKTTYDQIPYSIPENNTNLIPLAEVRAVFNDAWDKTILNNEDAMTNLKEAQEKANAILKE